MKLTIDTVNRHGDRRINYYGQTIHVEAADWKEFQMAVSEAEDLKEHKEWIDPDDPYRGTPGGESRP